MVGESILYNTAGDFVKVARCWSIPEQLGRRQAAQTGKSSVPVGCL